MGRSHRQCYFVVVGLDVNRTDRALVFYENEANQGKLWDVLAVYAWLDNDIGYVQGEFFIFIFFQNFFVKSQGASS